MARLPEFKEQFIPTATTEPEAGVTGENIAQGAQILSQLGQQLLQRKNAKEMTRVSELSTDLEIQLQNDFKDLQQQRALNPEGVSQDFNDLISKRKNELLKTSGLGFDARQSLSRIIDNQRGSFVSKAINFESNKQLENFANSVERTAENNNLLAFRAGEELDLGELQRVERSVEANTLAGSSFVDPDQLENMSITQIRNAHKNWFDGAIESDPYQSLDLLLSGKYDEKLGVENVQSLQQKARKRIKALEKEREKRLKKFLQLSRVSQALSGKLLLDPKTKDDVKDVSAFWDFVETQNNMEGATVTQRMEDAKIISEKVGIIPEQVVTTTSAMLINGEPQQQALAADFINDITINRPRTSEQYDSTTKTFAQAIYSNVNAGIEPKKAVDWARNSVDFNLKKERDIRQKEYSGGKNAKEVQRDIKKISKDLKPFFGDIEVNEDLLSDFATLQENYFMNEGADRDTSYKLAKKDIENMYAITNVGKRRYMKYAPELFYGQEIQLKFGVEPDWINKQVLDTINEIEPRIFATEKEFKEFVGNVSVEVNPDSIIGGGSPTYYIFTQNEFGGTEIVLDKNNIPFEYIPDFRKTEEYKQIETQAGEVKDIEDIRELIKEERKEREFLKKHGLISKFNRD